MNTEGIKKDNHLKLLRLWKEHFSNKDSIRSRMKTTYTHYQEMLYKQEIAELKLRHIINKYLNNYALSDSEITLAIRYMQSRYPIGYARDDELLEEEYSSEHFKTLYGCESLTLEETDIIYEISNMKTINGFTKGKKLKGVI